MRVAGLVAVSQPPGARMAVPGEKSSTAVWGCKGNSQEFFWTVEAQAGQFYGVFVCFSNSPTKRSPELLNPVSSPPQRRSSLQRLSPVCGSMTVRYV